MFSSNRHLSRELPLIIQEDQMIAAFFYTFLMPIGTFFTKF